jgi:hypothetical protein
VRELVEKRDLAEGAPRTCFSIALDSIVSRGRSRGAQGDGKLYGFRGTDGKLLAAVGGGGAQIQRRAPALCDRGTAPGAGARKPPKEETAGRWGPFGERAYGDLRIVDGCRARRRRPAALRVLVGIGDGGCFRRRRCTGARGSLRSNDNWRPRASMVSRSGAWPETKAIEGARRDAGRRS